MSVALKDKKMISRLRAIVFAMALTNVLRLLHPAPPARTPSSPADLCPSTARVAVWLVATQLGHHVPLGDCPESVAPNGSVSTPR